MSSKLSPFTKFNVAPQLWALLLFIVHGDKLTYLVHATVTMNFELIATVFLAMCSPLCIAVESIPLPVQRTT